MTKDEAIALLTLPAEEVAVTVRGLSSGWLWCLLHMEMGMGARWAHRRVLARALADAYEREPDPSTVPVTDGDLHRARKKEARY